MTKTLKVILWGEEIGRLAWDGRRHLSYFIYNPDFIKKGLNISPLVAPIERVILCLMPGVISCLNSGDNRIIWQMQTLLHSISCRLSASGAWGP